MASSHDHSSHDHNQEHTQPKPSAATPTFDLEHPERLDFTGVDGPSLVRDLGHLEPHVCDAMMCLLRSGNSSRIVTELILSHPCPDFPHFDYASVLYRVEFVRRQIKLDENSSPRRDADWYDAEHRSKEPRGEADATTIPQASQIKYTREQGPTLLRELRQLPGLLLDIATGLLLTGEASEADSSHRR